MYRIDNWINEGSGWIIESIEGEYLNISVYAPLFGITYIELPDELKNSMKRLINIKNSDNKCFLWSHVKHLNLVKRNSQRINKEDKKIVNKFNYEEIIVKLKSKIISTLMCFVMIIN